MIVCRIILLLFVSVSFLQLQAQTSGAKKDFDAVLEHFSAPAVVLTGQTFRAEIILRNTGTETWNQYVQPVWLGFQGTSTWLGTARISTDSPREPHLVAPGEQARFLFDCTAPKKPGVFPFSWRMVAEGVAWFGDMPQKIITVVSNPENQKAAEHVWNYDFKIWQAEDGLPHNTIHALLQTRDGYIWVGTQNGLARFDGVRFQVFDADAMRPLASSVISALAESSDGTLWIGTSDSGLACFRRGNFTFFTEKEGLVNNSVRVLHCDSQGALWIGTTNGLSSFRDGKFCNFTAADKLPASTIRALADDGQGNLWIGSTGDGIHRIRDGKVAEVLRTNLPSLSVRALYLDRDGRLWGAGFGAVFHLSPEGTTAFGKAEGLPHDIATAIHQDRMGNFWIGSYGGVVRLSSGKWQMESDPRGVSLDFVSSIIEDREGNIWCGSKDGLVRFKPEHFFTYTQQEGLKHNNVMSVCEDVSGAVWAGTWGGGLNRILDGRITDYSQRDGLSLNLILALQPGNDGELWIGTDFDGGLNRRDHGKFENWKIPGTSIRVIHRARDGTLWIGTSQALIQWKEKVLARFTKTEGLAGNTVRAICEDEEGALWIGTNEGLSRRRQGGFQNFTMEQGLGRDAILALYFDTTKALWVGTAGGGVARLKDGRFVVCRTANGLFSDDISEMLEDDFGRLWMSSPKGIFFVPMEEINGFATGAVKRVHSTAFGKTDGLQSVQCNSVAKPGAWKSGDGRIWFATTRGLAVVDPGAVQKRSLLPKVIIEDVIADKKVKSLEGHRSSTSNGELETLNFPPGRGELEFRYTALDFADPEKNQFRYRLEGADSQWTDAGMRRVAYYNNLRPGKYVFHVMACSRDGVWTDDAAELAVILQPHLWQMRWFQGCVALLGLGMVAGIVRFVAVQRLQRQLLVLEKNEAVAQERTRIAQDMHDDLGARLTEIMFLNGAAEQCPDAGPQTKARAGKAAETARELVQSLDAIVWAVEPRNDTLENLAAYLQDYAERFLNNSGIQCFFDVQKDLPSYALSSEVRHNIFLVAKETLNNIAKHSGATEVRFSLQAVDACLQISIQDNGKGFSRDAISPLSNGLHNMKERMKSIGSAFEICSEPGQGTRSNLSVPVGKNEDGKRKA